MVSTFLLTAGKMGVGGWDETHRWCSGGRRPVGPWRGSPGRPSRSRRPSPPRPPARRARRGPGARALLHEPPSVRQGSLVLLDHQRAFTQCPLQQCTAERGRFKQGARNLIGLRLLFGRPLITVIICTAHFEFIEMFGSSVKTQSDTK